MKYYLYHIFTWPDLSYVAVDTTTNRVVGYVLGKIDEEKEEPVIGHITSLAVARSHRKQSLATKLMQQAARAMRESHRAAFCALHVRRTNRAALSLYQGVLGFYRDSVDEGYYADGEDAFYMRRDLDAGGFQLFDDDGVLYVEPGNGGTTKKERLDKDASKTKGKQPAIAAK